MSETVPAERINYLIRPNKSIQRKLFLAVLESLKKEFDIENYCYIGFGSYWFADFKLLHKALNIRNMVSIEKEGKLESRVRFNSPYDCIDVEIGDSTLFLSSTNWNERPTILWLDYEEGFDGPFRSDFEIAVAKAKEGSILMATLNGNAKRYLDNRGKGSHAKRVNEGLANIGLTRYLSETIDKNSIKSDRFPKIMGETAFNIVDDLVRVSGRNLKFIPLFNFHYIDSSHMVVIGGMLGANGEIEKLKRVKESESSDILLGRQQVLINVPLLTPREKIAFDAELPDKRGIFPAKFEATTGYSLRENQIQQYLKYYRQYPIYTEIEL